MAKKKSKTKSPAKKSAKKPAKKAAPKKPAAKSTTKKSSPKTSKPSGTNMIELKPGDSAPQFSLPSDTGQTVSLSNLRGKTVILYFYPKDATPGCTQEACDFRDSFASFKKSNAVVLGVSRDSVESHRKFKEKQSLPFELLADVDGKVCEAYGVWKEKSLYGRKFMGIERTTFVIDPQGRIARVFPKVRVNGHIQEILGNIASS